MEASHVARQLAALGYGVLRVQEEDGELDAAVYLNDVVEIQLARGGRDLIVNRFDGEAWHHSPAKHSVADLKPEIDKALAEAEACGPIVEKEMDFDVLCNGEVLDTVRAFSHAEAQQAVDEMCSPGTCIVVFAGADHHIRSRFIEDSRALALAAVARADIELQMADRRHLSGPMEKK